LNFNRCQAAEKILYFIEREQYVKEPSDLLGHFYGAKIRAQYAKLQHMVKKNCFCFCLFLFLPRISTSCTIATEIDTNVV